MDDIRLFIDHHGLFWGRVVKDRIVVINDDKPTQHTALLDNLTPVEDGQEVIVTHTLSISLCQTVEIQPGMGQKEIEAAAWAAMLEERGAIKFKDCGIDKIEFDLGVPQATIKEIER